MTRVSIVSRPVEGRISSPAIVVRTTWSSCEAYMPLGNHIYQTIDCLALTVEMMLHRSLRATPIGESANHARDCAYIGLEGLPR